MLETVDLTRKLSKAEYKALVEPLQIRLGELQRQLRGARVPTLLVFEGWDAAGKGTTIGALIQPLDPRGFRVFPDRPPTEDERMRPFLWRFWQRMPRAGEISIFDRSWYTRVLRDRVEKEVPKRLWRSAYAQINDFESTLVDGGLVLLKFWLHISKKEQRRRFDAQMADPAERWKVSKSDWRQHARYAEYTEAAEEMLARTSTASAPWTLVEASDRRFAAAKVYETVATAWEDAAARTPPPKPAPTKPVGGRTRLPTVLQTVDLTQQVTPEAYARELEPLQRRLRALEHHCYVARIPVTIVCEGWDAAGKGGAIRRLTAKLDPRGMDVIGVSAPNDEERAHHYLWRFWRHVPKDGHITIFDRSWYGRVLVERVEGFCRDDEWRRAYRELNEFESQLTESGGVVIKLWFHIDRDTQLARFRERERVGYKKWKITGEDWRNREKWPLYEDAVAEMLQHTSTTYAPWKIVAANDKYHARLSLLRFVVGAVENALRARGVDLEPHDAAVGRNAPTSSKRPKKPRTERKSPSKAKSEGKSKGKVGKRPAARDADGPPNAPEVAAAEPAPSKKRKRAKATRRR